MQRQREKGMVTMMSRTERAVRMKAVMPGSLSSAAKKKRGRGESSDVRREQEGRGGGACARDRLKE